MCRYNILRFIFRSTAESVVGQKIWKPQQLKTASHIDTRLTVNAHNSETITHLSITDWYRR